MTGFKALDLGIELYKECEKLQLRNPVKDQLLRASLRETQVIVKIIGNTNLEQRYNKLGALVYGLTRKI